MVRSDLRSPDRRMRARVLFPCLWILICAWLAQAESVSVAELGRRITGLQSASDKTAARALGHLQLDERLSSDELAALLPRLPGERSRVALLGIADSSIFLDPPRSEFVMLVAPSVAEQGQILSRAYDFVEKSLPNLPNFMATRELTRMQSAIPPWKVRTEGSAPTAPFRKVDHVISTVTYRDGEEVSAAQEAKARKPLRGLTASGVFAPLLQTTVADILRGKVAWSYWQRTEDGRAAVFRYEVETTPHFRVHFCCLDSSGSKAMELTPRYHGEIAIEPDSGRVVWIVIQSEPAYGFIRRADVAIEYGTVILGGVGYVCPLYSVARSVTEQLGRQTVSAGSSLDGSTRYRSALMRGETTSINHMEFRDYHVFRAEMRVMPGFDSTLPPHKR